jgi:hypothetical protein
MKKNFDKQEKTINFKELEKKFKKILHNDLKKLIDFKIIDYDLNTNSGNVVFLYDMEEIFNCNNKMVQSLNWYLNDNILNYTKARNSNNQYDRGLALLDGQTGFRSLKDFEKDESKFVQILLDIKKKHS